MTRIACFCLIFGMFCSFASGQALKGEAARLFELAKQESRHFAKFEKLGPEVVPTSDSRAFFAIWKTCESPKKWIVSLHGAGNPAKGFATDDIAIWSDHLKNREVGIICIQWWLGTGSMTKDFLNPLQMYREIDQLLAKMKIETGSVMLHGFSRGSANIYAVAAIDAGVGKKYFSLIVASSGGVALNYPPTRSIISGDFGKEPLKGTRWITCAGEQDPNPDRDGVPGMRRTGAWLKEQSAILLFAIEDKDSGHGALVRNPENAKRVLDEFLKVDATPEK